MLATHPGVKMTKKIFRTTFHYITAHTRNAATSYKVWNWKTTMEVGDTLYLFMPAYGEYSKKTVTEFVRAEDFDGSPGGMFFIDEDETAYTVDQLADHIIKRADGSWVYARTGADAAAYAERYNVEDKVAYDFASH